MRRSRAHAWPIAAALALVSGCTDDGVTDAAPDEPPPDEADATSSEPDSDADGAAEPAPHPDSEEASEAEAVIELDDPIATVVHEIPDARGATITVDVRSLEEVGELLRVGVTFSASWDGDPGLTLAQMLGAGPNAPAAGVGLRLTDPVNLLEYSPVRPSIPNGRAVDLVPDTPLFVPFYFGAPQGEPESLDVHIDVTQAVTPVPPMVDVPYDVP